MSERSATSPSSDALRSTAQIPLRALSAIDAADAQTTRIPLADPSPAAPEGFPPKAFAGEVIPFRVVAFREGHDLIGVHLRLRTPQREESLHRLTPLNDGTDRWQVDVALDETARLDVPVRGVRRRVRHLGARGGAEDRRRRRRRGDARAGRRAARPRREGQDPSQAGAQAAGRDRRRPWPTRTDPPTTPSRSRPIPSSRRSCRTGRSPRSTPPRRGRRSWSSATLAGAAAWYEFFPRSEGAVRNEDGTWTSGTFRTAAQRLPAVAAMGFDVVYLPPIHPIGRLNRKGPNNTLDRRPRATRARPGPSAPRRAGTTRSTPISAPSPTSARSSKKAEAARPRGRASTSRCRPRPTTRGWRRIRSGSPTLPDGTIAYAENPPKKYQDIYPLNFDNDPVGLYTEVLRIVRALDLAGRAHLPRRQPAHQAAAVLGVADPHA